jgi:hypothetical protein
MSLEFMENEVEIDSKSTEMGWGSGLARSMCFMTWLQESAFICTSFDCISSGLEDFV